MIKLEVHICDQRRSYIAEFATEDQALEFVNRKMRTHAFYEMEEFEIPADCERLIEFLYPTCIHGMSESLCEGPMHYSDRMYV